MNFFGGAYFFELGEDRINADKGLCMAIIGVYM